jgi:hypothetical protein
VPFDVRLVVSASASLLRDRTLCLIDRSGCGGWPALLTAVLQSAKPHIVLFAGRDEMQHAAGIPLERLPAQSLIDALCPPRAADRVAARIASAARKAEGLPGRFAELLWGAPGPGVPGLPGRRPLRAAEQPAVYGPGGEAPGVSAPRRLAVCPARELADLRRRMEGTLPEVELRGYASAVRTLQQVVGALARRRDWPGAAQGGLALARSLLKRGKPREAQTVIGRSADHARAAGDDRLLFDAAVLAGSAGIELARLDEAEHLLRAAIAAAPGVDAAAHPYARLTLARCLFWLGRYDEAAAMLAAGGSPASRNGPRPREGRTSEIEARVAVAEACIAVGRRDLSHAVGLATEALDAAQRLENPAFVSCAAYGAAFAHLAVGDAAAVDRDVTVCVRAARAARDTLSAL